MHTPTWEEVEALLKRSYTFKLLLDFLDRFDQTVYGKINFSVLQERQNAFDHLLEVFEQDLRLGEQTDVAVFCKTQSSHILANVVYAFIASEQSSSVEHNLALQALVDNNKYTLAKEWLASGLTPE